MRRTLLLCRVALAGGATVLAVAACGGGSTSTASNTASSGSSAPATTTTTAPTTAPITGAGGEASGFCAEAVDFARKVESSIAQTPDQADLGQRLQELAAELQSLTPPPEIAADWRTTTSAISQMAQAYAQANLSDPKSLGQLQQQLAPVTQQLATSAAHIDQYLQNTCGFSPGADETASTNTG